MNLPNLTQSPPPAITIAPTTNSRPYSFADVALRFLSLLPDLGVIAVIGILAHDGKIEGSTSLLAFLAVLAGRLNPSALKLGLGGGNSSGH